MEQTIIYRISISINRQQNSGMKKEKKEKSIAVSVLHISIKIIPSNLLISVCVEIRRRFYLVMEEINASSVSFLFRPLTVYTQIKF